MSELLRVWNRLFNLSSLIDILVVALIFFWLLEVIKDTRGVRLLRGIGIALAIALFLSSTLENLTTLSWLLNNAIRPALFVAIPVLFQPELRRAMETLGRTGNLLSNPFGSATQPELAEAINTISKAAVQLSRQNTGALIVMERGTRLQEYADRGVILDARLAVPLLLNIFYPNSPLHDMAVIVRENRILAANVVLPLSEDVVGHRRYGTRHRAAKGISEQTDAVVVVVSEETGTISVVHDGRMVSYLSEARLRSMLRNLVGLPPEEGAAQ
jgi:uncharacterized protein (TIGR00159 family)